MSVQGLAIGARHEPSGTELTADAAIGATVLSVDWAELFSDEGGTLELNGTMLDYLTSSDETDTVTLAAPLAAAATAGDRVYVVDGGQVSIDYELDVDLGDGDPVTVPIPFEQRPMWPEGDYDDPVPVVVSDDYSELLSVPRRTPTVEGVFVFNPKARAVRSTPQSIPHDTWTRLVGATRTNVAGIDSGATNGLYVPEQPGEYLVAATARFEANATGQREIVVAVDGVRGIGVSLPPAPGADSVQVVDVPLIHPSDAAQGGKEIEVQVRQTSGASLAVTNFQIKITRIAPL